MEEKQTIERAPAPPRTQHEAKETAPAPPRTQQVIRPKASGYGESGASWAKRAMKGFKAFSGSPHDDIDLHNQTLRQRSRILYTASPVATSAINTNRTNVVGPGLELRSMVKRNVLHLEDAQAREWQETTEAEFEMWAQDKTRCDALGLNNFHEIQQLTLKSWLMSGDAFVLIKRYPATPFNPYGLRLHVIEADRISTPPYCGGSYGLRQGIVPPGYPGAGHLVYDGVEVDENGMVVAYYVCNRYPNETLMVGSGATEWTRVEAVGQNTGLPNILHIMETERPDQYRGVPYLAQVIEPLLQLRRYTESELMAALVQTFFTAWIETKADPSVLPFNETGELDEYGNPSNVSEDPNEYEMGPGTVTVLQEGEEVKFGNPNIPTAGFETFVKTVCKMVGAALEIPEEILLKEFDSSYSASRGALLEAWKAFKMRRSWFVSDFCQPVYRLWLSEAVARGRIKAPGFFVDPLLQDAWCSAQWTGPAQDSLDPLKEANADLALINAGIKTHAQVTIERNGGDWEKNITQLKHEKELLSEGGFNYAQTGNTGGGDPGNPGE